MRSWSERLREEPTSTHARQSSEQLYETTVHLNQIQTIERLIYLDLPNVIYEIQGWEWTARRCSLQLLRK